MPFRAIIDKHRLKSWLNSRDDPFVNVPMGDFPRRTFEMQLLDLVVYYLRDAAFLRIDSIYKNFTIHGNRIPAFSYGLSPPGLHTCLKRIGFQDIMNDLIQTIHRTCKWMGGYQSV